MILGCSLFSADSTASDGGGGTFIGIIPEWTAHPKLNAPMTAMMIDLKGVLFGKYGLGFFIRWPPRRLAGYGIRSHESWPGPGSRPH
jgi:hypothetical protein